MKKLGDISRAKIVQLIEIKECIGSGIEKDPVREITQYRDFDGNIIAIIDPFENINNEQSDEYFTKI